MKLSFRLLIVGLILLMNSSCEESNTLGSSPSGLPIVGSCYFPSEDLGDISMQLCWNILEPMPQEFVSGIAQECEGSGGTWQMGCPMAGYVGNCVISLNDRIEQLINPADYPGVQIPPNMQMEYLLYDPFRPEDVTTFCSYSQGGGI